MAERPGSSALRACKKQAHSWGAASSQGADREVLCWHDLQQAATAEQDKQVWLKLRPDKGWQPTCMHHFFLIRDGEMEEG